MEKKQFEKLYDEYFDCVTRFLFYYSNEKEQIEDWVQEVFFRLWKYRYKIEVDDPFIKAYLLKTAKNVALASLKKKNDKDIIELQPHLTEKMVNINKEAKFDTQEFSKKYISAVNKIPSKSRKIFKLSKESGYSYKEIALIFQISHKTVEAHISKALRILRIELREFKF